MKVTKRILVLGDIHFNHEHRPSIELALKIADKWRPTHIVQGGDMVDSYSLNRFGINPRRAGESLAQEAAAARRLIAKLRRRCDEFRMLEGNHEARLKRAFDRNPELSSTHPGMRELLDLAKSEWTPYGELWKLGNFYFAHDVGKSGANAARDTLNAVASNIVFVHTHRAGTYYGGNMLGERHVSLNAGWLGDARWAEYASDAQKASWTRGVGTVSMLADGRGWANFVPFLSGTAVVDGKVVSL